MELESNKHALARQSSGRDKRLEPDNVKRRNHAGARWNFRRRIGNTFADVQRNAGKEGKLRMINIQVLSVAHVDAKRNKRARI